MDNQELQNSVAKIAETLITTQRNLVTVSRSLWAVRMSIRKMHPEFEDLYLNHFAEPEQAFEKMRDNLLDYGRELADLARRLRGEPASANTGFPLTTFIDSTVPPLDPLELPP